MAEFDPVEFLKSTEEPSSGKFNSDTFLKETAPAPSQPAMTAQQRYRQTLKAYHDQGTENPDVAPGYVSPETSKAFAEDKANIPQLGAQWGDVGIGAAKGLAGGLSGGLVGDIESLVRLPFQIPGVREYIADVSPHTVIPTSEEGGYLGPRGLGAFNAPETPEEKGGAFIGSMISPNVVSGGAKAVGKGIKHIAGQATFVGPKALEIAYSAGKEGGEAAQAFRENITKSVDLADIIPEVKSSIDNMRAARNAGYVSDMKELGKNVTPLNFDEIDKAVARSTQVKTFKGQDLSPATTKIRQEMNDAIKEWRSLDPAEYHTPVGMDALKQKLGDFMDNTLPRTPERVAASDIYNAVRQTIIKEAPEYAPIMKAYENSSVQIKEIEKALSLGNNASADTGLRKLQSILRDNVNASYGSREQLAKYLIANGSPHLMEKLAGQALSPYTPRGLGKLAQNVGAHMAAIAAAASTGGVAPILTFMAGVPVSSPRLMGNLSYLSGVAARYGEKIPAKAAIRTGILADTVTPDVTQPRVTGGSVFDKMHMARKRAEGGGTDVPFNEWDAVPRNAEGIPQIRIEKPPVNEADEAQAAREAAAARIAGNVRGAPYEPTPPSTEGKTWMMEPGKEAVQSGNYEMPPNVRLNDAGIPYNVETGEELQMARRPSVLPLTRTPDGVEWAMPKAVELAGDIVNPLAVTKGVALNPGEFALGSGPIRNNGQVFRAAAEGGEHNIAARPNKRASAEDINRAADESAGMTQAELRALYNELGITGTPPSSLVKPALADQPKSAIDAATSMKLEDIAAMNKLSKKDRELFVKGKLPNFVLPSQEAAAPARTEFDKVRKEIKKAETEFDLLRATRDEPRLFDLSSEALNKVPNVDQFRLPRVEPKITERLQPAYAGGAGLKRLERAAEKASSADYGWYQLQQVRDTMHSIHGPKKGEMVWNAWLDSLAGTSMVNPISSNVRGSTYYLREAMSGRPLPQSIPVVDPKTGNVRWTLAGAPEAGYGAKAQIQHADRVREFMAHEGDPIANPKPMSYRQNLGGNWMPRTVDTHDIRNAVGMPHALTFGENAGLLPGEYAALEQLGEKAASRSGVPQAAQQAATWIGGGAYTKLKSIPIPLLNEINRRIHVTAKINGVTPDVLWRDVLRGKEILKFAGGSVFDKMHAAKHMAEGGGLESFIKSLGSQGAAFGTQTEQEQAGHQRDPISELGKGAYNAVEHLAKENIDNANLLATGNRDQFSGKPGFEAGMLTMGATPFGMTKGGVNIGHGPGIPLSFTERMEQGKQVAMNAYNRGAGGGSYGFSAKGRTAPDAPKGSHDRFIQENQSRWEQDKKAALDAYRQTVNPQESQHLLAPGESYADFLNNFKKGGSVFDKMKRASK